MKRTTPQRGMALQEIMITLAITASLLVGVAHLVATTAGQQRLSEQRVAAMQEAGNAMEDLMARPWSDLAGEEPPVLQPSDWSLRTLKDVRIQVVVRAGDNEDAVRRVEVQVDWQQAGNRRAGPVQLVAWRYRNQEAQP